MATTIVLKKREAKPSITLDYEPIKAIIDSGNREALWSALSEIGKQEPKGYIHDKNWLNTIASWQPKEGMPLKDQYRAMKLLDRLDTVDDDEECEFEISDKTKDFIISRMRDDNFRMRNLPIQFVRFVFDLEEQFDHHIISPEEEPE